MIRNIYLLPLLLLAIGFTACSETKEVGKYDNWRARNEAFVDSLQQVYDAGTDPELKRIINEKDKKVAIFYKKKPKNPASPVPVNEKAPYYTSTVRIAFRGMLINEAVFATATVPYYYTTLYKALDVFEGNIAGDSYDPNFDIPKDFKINGDVVAGRSEVLQRMLPGERWEIYVPYGAGYGASSSGSVLAYSTLIYDMELLDVVEY